MHKFCLPTPQFVLFLSILFLAACGGGDSGNIGNTDNTLQLNPGGNAAAPAQMSFDIPNEIKADPFENYYQITVTAGDTIVINTTLISPLDSTKYMGCQLTTSAYFISVNYGYSSCKVHFKQTFTSDGVYTFHFDDALNNYGYFDAALISAGTSLNPSSGATGRPDDPRSIILGGTDNLLSANSFYNNFIYDAQAGETLQIQTYPNILPSGTDNLQCQTNGEDFESYYSYGVSINDSKFTCNESFEYQFDQAGQYELNIRFLYGAEGFFRAVVF